MKSKQPSHSIFPGLIILFLTMGLTGCFKVEVSTDVKPNGSGMVSVALGMTAQAKALVSQDGSDGEDVINNIFNISEEISKMVQMTNWIDGEYEWQKAEVKVSNTDQINEILQNSELFNRFTLTRTGGLFRNEYILDAEMAPLSENASAGDFEIPISTVIQINYVLKLPGTVIETNGIADGDDPNRLTWTARENAVPIHARAVSWNWLNVILVAGGVFFFLLVGLVGIIFLVSRSAKKSQPKPM